MNNTHDKIYISGKITGIEKQASANFGAAAYYLALCGFNVVNPMLLPAEHDKSWRSYMRVCIAELCSCDQIYVMRNFWRSRGAIVELLIAIVLGIKIKFQ